MKIVRSWKLPIHLVSVSVTLLCLLALNAGPAQKVEAQTASYLSVIATIPVGVNPAGIAVNEVTDRIYVTNSADNTVSVIDGVTNTVVATVPVISGPSGIGVNPITNRIYVANGNGGSPVSVIDGNTNSVIASIPVDINTRSVAVNSNTNQVYVPVQTGQLNGPYVDVIDGSSNTVTSTVLGKGPAQTPQAITVDPNTNRIYVTDSNALVRVIDSNTDTYIATSPYSANGDIAFNPNTNLVYVTDASLNGVVSIIDGGSNTVLKAVHYPADSNIVPFGLGVNRSTDHILVADLKGSIALLDGISNTFIGDLLLLPGRPGYVAVNSVTNHVYVTDAANNQVYAISDDAVVKHPAPVLLVHGWQGLSAAGGYHCSMGTGRYPGTDSTLNSKDGSPDLADWLRNEGYDVWIAHLETTPLATPPLEWNARCLRDQINEVYAQNPQPITIIAHSMGGLVSRAAIRYLGDPGKVKALYTLGSPHVGIPLDTFHTIFNLECANQPAACEMTPDYMSLVYNRLNPNIEGVRYAFIGGSGGSGMVSSLLGWLGQNPNDGLVGQNSAVGWDPNGNFVPSSWVLRSMPGQYVTDETHPADSDANKAYYVAPAGQKSASYKCISGLMKEPPDLQDCRPAGSSGLQMRSLDTHTLSSDQPAFTEIKTGHLEAGQEVLLPFEIDSSGAVLFYLHWSDGSAPSFTLTRPDTQMIDPAYALAHPAEVAYETSVGNPEVPPSIVYSFVSGQAGTWQANIIAGEAIDYKIFGLIDSALSLAVQTNTGIYRTGSVATITAHLDSGGTGLSGASVTAALARPDGVVDEITLADQGDGKYVGTYIIPDSLGYLTIAVTANGTKNGTAFSRQKNVVVPVASNDLQVTGSYSDQPRDDNTDGLYERLDFFAEVNLATPGEYAISGELYTGDQLITQSGDFFSLGTGLQNVTLSFDGGAIREAGLGGPYTIRNLYLTPIDTGIPAQSVENAWTTSAYSYTQFGSYPCYALVAGHNGSGTAPTASPAHSAGCAMGEYKAGASIDLSASPDPGWQVHSWSGTGNDASMTSTNHLIMPASTHAVSVEYFQTEYTISINVVGDGLVSKTPNQTTYHYGDSVQISAIPTWGWAFMAWSGDLAGTANPKSISVTSNQVITATFIVAPTVSAPRLIRPRSNQMVNSPSTFTWTNVLNADHYEIAFARDSSFNEMVDTQLIDAPSFTPAALFEDGKYYWHVRAYNALGGSGGWSASRYFIIDTLSPAPPLPALPSDHASLRGVPTFRWDPVSGAVLYQFQFDDDLDFSSPLVSVNQRMTSRKPSGSPRGTYFWRVRAQDAAGNWSDWSQTFTVTILPPR